MRVFFIFFFLTLFSSQLSAQEELVEEIRPDGVATKRQLNERVQKLERVVRELQLRVRHLESASKDVKPLEFYRCKLSPLLSRTFEKRAESREEATVRVIQACQRANSDSSLCNQTNVSCKKEER